MTPIQMLIAIAKAYGISLDTLRGPDQSKSMRIRRSLAMLTIRENTELSFPEMARLFKRLNHTTVLASCRSGELYRVSYPELAEQALRAVRPIARVS